jgi:hypothetical protein
MFTLPQCWATWRCTFYGCSGTTTWLIRFSYRMHRRSQMLRRGLYQGGVEAPRCLLQHTEACARVLQDDSKHHHYRMSTSTASLSYKRFMIARSVINLIMYERDLCTTMHRRMGLQWGHSRLIDELGAVWHNSQLLILLIHSLILLWSDLYGWKWFSMINF